MRNMSLSDVLHRSLSGQAMTWGSSTLPPLHEHLLLRLNGYSALGDLIADAEDTTPFLDAATELFQRGLVDLIESEADAARIPSGWMDLPING